MRVMMTAAVLAGVGLGIKAAADRRAKQRDRRANGRWLAVTVCKPVDEVGAEGRLPEPLARLGDHVETRVTSAPADRGTELYARPRAPSPSGEDLRSLRVALREAKSIIETGEVVQADAHPSAHPGPAGKLLAMANRKAKGVGRL
ncbi:hypothetical protein [Jiangella ureilytica]|uniref:hypothetical protein n=1 Tax=Jiangella ureilytica TaxID=2530374 RepID=UPI00193CE260|nr:hypothetical protein [Jiangella ureilytica]